MSDANVYKLFPDDPEGGISDVASEIAANAPDNPYASQDQRAKAIVELRQGEDLGAEQTGLRDGLAWPETVTLPTDRADSYARHPSSQRNPFRPPGAQSNVVHVFGIDPDLPFDRIRELLDEGMEEAWREREGL